jgi:hypothetical protein
MSRSWKKLGFIFNASGQHPWMQTHAAVPFAEPMGGNLFRVYFSARDSDNRAHTGTLIMELSDTPRVVDLEPHPTIAPGNLGCFDDSGAMLSWITKSGNDRYYYYIGWNRGVTVPFRNSVGLAVAYGDGKPSRYAEGPILDRTMFEPHFVANPCVLKDGALWRMWYLACTEWRVMGGKPEHRYHIKYAESEDGINWQRDRHVAIDYIDDRETAISRPCVIRDSDCWRMWYSYRGQAYRIGYATSLDGKNWTRRDSEAGIDTSPSGWDSTMIEYPHVFDHNGARYMLYNGNRFGETGFGLAIWED